MAEYSWQIEERHRLDAQKLQAHITAPRPPAPLSGEWRIRQLLIGDSIEERGIKITRLASGVYGMMRNGVWYAAGSNYTSVFYTTKIKQALMLFNDLANGLDCADNIAKMCPRCNRMPAFLTAHGIAMCEDCAYGDEDKPPCVQCGAIVGRYKNLCETCYRKKHPPRHRRK